MCGVILFILFVILMALFIPRMLSAIYESYVDAVISIKYNKKLLKNKMDRLNNNEVDKDMEKSFDEYYDF